MKEVKLLLNDEKTYHVGEVLEDFKDYFGISFEELVKFFCDYKTITKEEIKQYIINNPDKMWETQINKQAFLRKKAGIIESGSIEINPVKFENIVIDRMLDYEMFYQRLTILAHKGKNYLTLLEYVAKVQDIFHEEEFYELIFDYLNISHYGKIMIGKHLKQILIPLNHIVKDMKHILDQINNVETYHMQNFDSFARLQGESKFYSIDNVVCNKNSYTIDKTAIYCSKIRKLKI